MPRLMIGYLYPVNKNYNLIAKAGASLKMPLDGVESNQFYGLRYYSDDSMKIKDVIFGREYVDFGNANEKLSRKILSLDFYIGIEKQLQFKFLKNICLGLESSFITGNPEYKEKIMIVSNKERTNMNQLSTDYYYNKATSMGIRISVGL